MANFQFGTIRSTVVANIAAQVPAGVTVHRYPLPVGGDVDQNPVENVSEWVELGWFRADRGPGTYGPTTGRRDDDYLLPGAVWVLYSAPTDESYNVAVQVAEDRAGVLLDAVTAAVANDFTLGGAAVSVFVDDVAEVVGGDPGTTLLGFEYVLRIQLAQA